MASTTVIRSDLNIQDLLDAGLHFGHQTKRWNPKMKRYIFGERNGIYIIDLNQTQDLLGKARQFVYDPHLARTQNPVRRHQETGASC